MLALLLLPGGSGSLATALRPQRPALPRLVMLRGGGDTAVAAVEPVVQEPTTSVTSIRDRAKKTVRKNQKKSAGFGARDGAAVVLCLSALGATYVSHGSLMAAFPKTLSAQSAAWVLIGGLLTSAMYALVALVHYERAVQIGAPICKLVFGGVGPRSSALVRIFSAPAILFVLGSVASVNTLPQMAG